MSAKKLLRDEMKKKRLEDEFREERSDKIFNRFFAAEFLKDKESFFIYNSFGTEANTKKIITQLLKTGKLVFLPRVEGREMFAVQYSGEPLVAGKYGIDEPRGEKSLKSAEVCILPLLAADKQFYRLGYGGGFYDRYLSAATMLKVGICFDYQITDGVPHEEHDVLLDAIITDERVLIRR